jgi:hypothetical protein
MKPRRAWLIGLAVGTLLLVSTPASMAAVGSPFGARVQYVAPGHETDVKIVNCYWTCVLTRASLGPTKHTLRCLDETNETSTAVWPQRPSISHPCIVESTLELNGAEGGSIVWRANTCEVPECGPWQPVDPVPPWPFEA